MIGTTEDVRRGPLDHWTSVSAARMTATESICFVKTSYMQFVRAFGHDEYGQEVIDPPKGGSGHQEIPIKEIVIGTAAVFGNFVQR